MSELDRRTFMTTVSMASLTRLTPTVDAALAVQGQSLAPAGTPPTGVTRTLAQYVLSVRYDDLPDPVRKEARRTLLNWMGCAVGGSRHETVDVAIAALAPFSGPAQATVLGRRERLDILHASLMNGISSHVYDFDDTHLKTVIHPAGPVVSALLALAEHRPISGRDFLTSLVVGIEAECRIGNAVYPAHYDRGWHITGTAGVFGAAAACGRSLGLNEQQMVWALGLAATQPVGLREMFGTMTKSFHPGRAAQNGLTAALLASRGFTSTELALEGKSGWTNVLSTSRDFEKITGNLGRTFEISLNTYKPFACGIVIHPTIDACIQLRNEHRVSGGCRRAHRPSRAPARLGTDRKTDADDWPRKQVQRLLCGRARHRRRFCGHARFQRREREEPGDRRAARPRDGDGRSDAQRGAGSRNHRPEERRPPRQIHRTCGRQRGAAHERYRPGRKIPEPHRGRASSEPVPNAHRALPGGGSAP